MDAFAIRKIEHGEQKMNSDQDILSHLKKISMSLEILVNNQHKIENNLNMLFSDITGFENLVLKVMDNFLDKKEEKTIREKFHH